MIEQTTLHNILTWIIAVILFIFQSLNYFISQLKKIVKHGQKNTTVVTTDTIILSESNENNNNAPENVITVQGLIQKHFDIPLIIAEDEPKVNDFIKNAQLLTSYQNYKEKKKIDQFMEHLVDDSYVARGLGLITANVGREAEFYLYSKYDNNFENVVIKLKGRQGEIGQITIPNQNPTNSIETKSIPMDYFYDEDRIKVTYTPFAEGVYTLTLVRNGLSICRSPYYISVEKSPTNSRSQIRLGTKKYKMVTKFAKAKHVPLETCDNSIPLIEPSKPSISRNILPTPEENSIRTDVMSIVTKFESNSIHFQKNDQKPRVNTSKKSTKTDLFDKISISADSNTQPKIETGNYYDTNINDLSSLSINSNFKSNDQKCSSNLNVSNRNSKSNYVNSIEIESNLVKKSNKKLDESIRNINDISRVKNISSNHLEPTNSALLKESLNDKSLDDVEKHNQTYKTNERILGGQNQIETFLDPITVDKSEIKCIDNEACTHNEVSCFDDDDRKTVIVKKNINELETHPNISMNRKFTDSTQYNINTNFTSVLTKITNDVCEKCSIKVLRILSEFPRDINITHNNNSNENCSSFEKFLAQPISMNINIDNLFEKPISPTNEHKTDNLLTNSPLNMKLMDTIDKDIKYHYINEIKPIDTTFNEIYCDINNTTTELIVKQNKHNGKIKKTINDKITNNFTIPLTKNNIDKPKTDHIENILSTDNKMQIQVQNVQKSSEHNMDIDKTNKIQFHEYINNELNDINKENGKILDTCDNIVTISNDKKSNEELVSKELKAKNVIIADEYKNIQSSFINSQTVLESMEGKLPTSRYKPENIRQEISNISNTNVILPENQKLIIENSIEPVLKSFKNKMVEKITQLYLNKDLTSSENTSILENHNINLTNSLQKIQLHNNADKNKTKLIETIRSQLKNHFHINDIPAMILNNKKTDNNQLYKYLENIIETNMNQNEIHSQRLDEINFQTRESIAKNQLNKQQLDNEFKIMTLENVTPNFKIKKTNDDEKVQDTKIKLKNIPNDTSTKIEATTNSIKSNTSEETDVESNIDNKKKVQKIVVEIVTNNNKMIVDSVAIIIHKETEENKQVAKNNTPKPNYWIQINDHEVYTINAYHDSIKPIDKDKVIETEMTKISIQTDITIYNNHKDSNKKEIEESIKNDLIIETPTIPVQKTEKVENLNQTKVIQYIDSSTEHILVEEPIDVEILYKQKILKTDVQTNKTKQNFKKESESCLLNDTSNIPVEQNNIIGKSIKHPISIENSNDSVKDSKVTKAITETELMKKSNSLALNKEEATGKENNPETEIETEKSIDKTIKEGEPISLIKTPTLSDDEKIIIEKTNETPINYVEDSKEVYIKTEPESILNKVYSIAKIEEPINNDNIPETETQTEKSKNKIYKESEPCSPTDIPTTSDEERIILEETAENPLLNKPTIKSVDEITVIDINTEITPNTDSPTVNVDEPIDKDIIPETETPTDKSTNNMNTESETCSSADTPTVSDEEKITIVETAEKPLLNDQPTNSIEIKTTPNTDSPTLNLEKTIDKDIISETQTRKSTDNINIKSEQCLPFNTPTISDEEKITIVETAEKSLLNDKPTKSIEIEIDSPTENVEAPIDIDVIPETETQIHKSTDNMNIESETCSRADIPTISDKEKITIVETTEKPLPNDQPIKSIEIETDSPTENIKEPIDKDVIPETETQTDKSTDKMNTESETCSSADTPTVSDKVKITIVETTEKPLLNDQPIKSIEIETDSPTENIKEPIDKDVIPETEKPTDKSTNNMNTESETCSSADTPTVSDEEKITIVETAEKPLLNDQPTNSIEIKTTPNTGSPTLNLEETIDKDIISETQTRKSTDNINIKSEQCLPFNTPTVSDEEKITIVESAEKSLLNDKPTKSIEIEIDSPTENVEAPIDIDVIPETETQIHKSTDNMNIESETCSRADIPTISDKEKITIVETTEKPLPNDQPIKSIEIETDSPTENIKEPIDKDVIPETETQTDKSTDKMNTESETCSSADTPTVSDKVKITIVETTEKPLLNDQPIKSIEIETDSPTENIKEPIDKDVIPETEKPTDKSTNNMNTESETCSSADTPTVSDEEKITIVETAEKPLLNDQPTNSIEIKTTPNTGSPTLNLEETIDKDIISETQTRKSTDNINIKSEQCLPFNTPTVSDEEKITIVESAEKSLLNDKPTKSIEIEIDSPTENVEAPIDIDVIPETETQIHKSTDNMNIESETCSRADIPTISDKEKITIVETTEKPLPNDQPIKSIEIETDSPTENIKEPIDKDVIPETETQTDKSTDKMNTESETCSSADTPTVSDKVKITIVETTEKPLPNDQPIKSIEIETDSPTENIKEPIDKDVIPETETQTDKSTDKMNTESETCSSADTPTVSDKVKITIVETTEKPLPNDKPTKSIEIEIDSPTENVEAPIDIDVIPETETQIHKSTDNMNIESETCSRADIPTISDEEKIILKETTEKALLNYQPTKFIEIETTPNTNSPTENVEAPIDTDVIPETQIDKSTDNMNIESETCSRADIPTISDEEKIILKESVENRLPNEPPIKFVVVESTANTDSKTVGKPNDKEVIPKIETQTDESTDKLNSESETCSSADTPTVSDEKKITIVETAEKSLTNDQPIKSIEIETTPNTDSPTENVKEPIDKDIISETQTQTGKSTDHIIIKNEPCLPFNTPTVSDEEKITIVETAEKSLLNDQPIKSIEIETTPNTDSPTENVKEPIDKDIISETQTQTGKSTDHIIIKNEPCLPFNTPTVSDEEKITIVETAEKSLLNDQPTKSIEIETNSPTENVEAPIDIDVIPETKTQIAKSTDNINIESETCSRADIPTVSDKEKITIVETTEKPLPNDQPIKSIEIETDSPTENIKEPIDKDVIPETETQTDKSTDKMNTESETCSSADTPTVSDKEKITIVETTEKPLPNDQPIKSIEIETDFPTENVEAPIDTDVIPETQIDKSTDNMNIESETCSRADIPTISDEEKIILKESVENRLPNEPPIKFVVVESTANTDSKTVGKPNDKEVIPKIETQTDESTDKLNSESETCSSADTPTVSDEKKITIVETAEKSLTNDQPIKSIEIETTPNTDSPTENVKEPIDKDIISETQTQTGKSTDHIIIKNEPCLPFNTPTVSDEEKITIVETAEKSLLNDQPIKSIEIETTPNTDSPTENVKEPIDKDIISETQTQTGKSTDHIIIKNKPCLPFNTPTVSDEEKITIVETAEKSLLNDQPTKSIEIETNSPTENVEAPIDIDVIPETKTQIAKSTDNINIESETCSRADIPTVSDKEKITIVETTEKPLPNDQPIKSIEIETDSPTENIKEPIDKDVIPETETQTDKSTDKMNTESETCSSADTPTVSDKEKITIVETTEKPLPNDQPIKSIEIETDFPTENVEAPIDTDVIPETQIDKSTDNMNIESETCSRADIPTISDEEKIILKESVENRLPNEPPIKFVVVESTANTDSKTVGKPNDKEVIPKIETQTDESTDKLNSESETCSSADTPTVSDEKKITIVETAEKSLTNDQPIKSIEIETTPNTDSPTENVKEPIDKDIISETQTQTGKSTDHIIIKNEPCLPFNTPTVSDEEKITIVETAEKSLLNDQPIKSIEIETTPNTDSPTENVKEPIDKDIISETQTQTGKSTDHIIIKNEPCLPFNTPTVSDEEKITIVETAEKSLLNDQPTKSIEIETNSPTENVEAPIDIDVIPETKTQIAKSTDNINIESETCSSADTPTVSDEKKIAIVKTAEKSLLNDQPTNSIEIETDSKPENIKEPIDKDVIPETETQTDKSMDKMNTESETCSLADTPTVSYKEKITIVETTEKPLPNDQPIKSIEIETTPNTDSPTENVKEPIDKDIISETQTQTGKSTDHIIIKNEPCLPFNTPTVSDEEKITIVQTAEKSLLNDQPTKSIEIEIDSPTENIEAPIDIDVIPETETHIDKSTDNMNTESETCSSADTPTVSYKEKITIVETTEKPLPNDQPIKSIEIETDCPTENIKEPIDKDVIPETETQTDKSTDKMNTESETCSSADTPTVSDKVKITMVETTEKPLPNDQPIKSIEIETDSPTENVEAPIDIDVVPETETQIDKSTDSMNIESETCSRADILTISDEENIILKETTEKALLNYQPIKSIEINITPNNNSPTENVEEPYDKDIIPETETQIEKSSDKMNSEIETCSSADTPTVSDEEKRTIVETSEKPLPNDQPNKSIEIATTPKTDTPTENVVEPIDKDIIPETETETHIDKSTDNMNTESETCSSADTPTVSDEEKVTIVETSEKPLPNDQPNNSIEIETTPNTDTPTENVEEPIDKDIIPETETQIEKSTDKTNTESELCSSADTPTVSDEENRTIVETSEKPLPNDQPNKSIEIETTPNTDTPTENVEEPIDKDIIPETETQTENSIDKIYKVSEPCSPSDIHTTSDEEKIILEETAENRLPNEPPIKFVEVESTPNTDSKTVGKPNDKEVIPKTETQRDESTDKMNSESETCSWADIPTFSDEEKKTIVVTTEKPLPNNQPFKSVDEIKLIDINTESESTPNTYTQTVNVVELIDKDIIPETETQIDKSTDNMKTKSETCSSADTPTVSDEEKIIIVETTEKPLPNDQPIKSIEIETDSPTENIKEPIDKDVIPETETQTDKSTDKMNTESETCSSADTPTVSDKEKITIVETTEKPLPNDQPIKSIEIETDFPTENVEAPIDTDVIPETQIDKSTDNMNIESETCSRADIPTISDEEKIILKESVENRLPNEPPIKFVVVESTANTDSKTVGKPNDKEVIPKIETQTDESTDKLNSESETCSSADTPTVSDEKKITIVETAEKSLTNDQPIKSIEIETTPNTDSPTENVKEPIDKDIISETQTQTGKSTDHIIIKNEPCLPFNTPTVSDEEKITIVETAEKSLLNDQPIKSIEIETTPNTDSPTENVKEPIDKDIISETQTQTGKSTDHIIIKNEPCLPFNTPTVSDEEKITIVETAEKSLLNDQPTKSIEIETNSPTENVEAPIDIDVIPETKTQIAKSTDNINIESETCSSADTPTVSDEKKIAIVKTAEKSLLNDQPTNSIEIETDSKPENIKEPIDKDVIPETETQTDKSMDKMNTESETCSLADTPTVSYKEKITIVETTEKPLPNDQPIKSIEIETTPNTDSPTENVKEPIDKDIISETQTQTGKSTDHIIIKNEPCLPFNTPTVSDEEKITIVQTAEKSLLNDQPTKSIEIEIDSPTENIEAPIDIDVIPETETHIDKSTDNMNTESETCSSADTPTVSYKEKITIVETTEKPLPNDQPIKSIEIETDCPTENIKEPIDKDVIPETETQTDKSTDKMNTESETCSSADTPTVSDKVKITMVETTEKPLPNDQPIKSIEIETDSPTENVEAPIDIDVVPETETQIDKSTDSMNIESETCSRADILTISDEENIILKETTEKALLNYQPIKSIEINITPNNNSPTENVEEPYDKDIIPETETQIEKSSDKMNSEIETCSSADTPTVSDEEKRTIVETSEKPLPNDQPNKSIEIATTPKTDTPTENVVEPIDKDIIPETETETHIDKSTDNMNTESETCSSADTPTVSDEEKVTIVETSEKPLPNDQPNNSIEIETTPNTDTPTENVEEPIDKDIIPETETQIEKSTDKTNTESESCSSADTPTVSDEENRTIVETSEKPLPNDQPNKSIEIETTPNTDTPTENVEEPIDKDIIPETETQTENSIDKIYKVSEPCSPSDIHTTSDEEKIILEETAENRLPNEPPIKFFEVESTPNTDSKTVGKPNDKEVIPKTETQRDESTDKMNSESETCSWADIPTFSDEEKKTIVVTTEKPLPNNQPFKSVDEIKLIDINTESESTPNTYTQTVNVVELIDKDIIPETETQIDKSTDNMKTKSETCSSADTPTVSDEEKIIIVETTEKPLPNDQPIKSIEIETTPNTDSPTENVEEPIDKDIISETQTQTGKSTDNINIISEPCSPFNSPTVSDEEKITIVETAEKSLLNDQPTNSIEIETDYPTEHVEAPIDIDVIPETETQIEKSTDKMNTECETCSRADLPTISDEEKIILEETAENQLLSEPPIKSVDEIKVIDINTEIETTSIIDSLTVNVEKPIDKDIISETQTQTGKSTDNINIKSEPCSPFNTPTVLDEEKIMIVETTEKLLLNETPIKSFEEFKVVDINTETEPSPNTDSLTVNVEALIDKENIREIQIETDKLIDNSNKECELCFPTDKLSASDEGNNLTKETIEVLSPIEISIMSSIKSVEESKVKKVNTETVFVPYTDSLTLNAEEPLYEDYLSKIVIKTDKTLDFIVKECDTCPTVDTSMYVREDIKGVDGTIEKLIPMGPSFVVVETENLTSIDGFNRIVTKQSVKEYLKDIESATRIDTAAFVKDQKVEENDTVIENILTINTSTASVQAQIQVEEVIKDESVILINDSDIFDEISSEEQKKIETVKISSITVMEEQTDISRGDVIYTCEESLDKTIVEKGIHSETTSTIDILAADVEEQKVLEIELSEYATQVLNDTSTETIENLIKTNKNTENETATPIVVAKSEVEKNEIKVMSENKTSTPVHLASTNTEQTETDMVTEIASSNVNFLNSNTKIILIDKEMITENSNNPKHCYLKFGETSKIHNLENEDNLPGKSYGIQKLEMSVQRMKTSNEDYYEKTFLQLEQTEKVSVENKDKVDCENKNNIDDKLYTVNESDLNAILCASSLEEALTLLDSKIKFKFKHRKLSNKANSTPHIPKIQTSESRSSGTNTNFTDAREFFKEIEKKCKK